MRAPHIVVAHRFIGEREKGGERASMYTSRWKNAEQYRVIGRIDMDMRRTRRVLYTILQGIYEVSERLRSSPRFFRIIYTFPNRIVRRGYVAVV